VSQPPLLIATNILPRISRRDYPDHRLVDAALTRLRSTGTNLYYTHQNISEFWNVATRPVNRNGFGLSVADVELETRAIEREMILLPDSAAVYQEWRRLVFAHSVSVVQVHDARLAAAIKVHAVSLLLTLNPDDFRRHGHVIPIHPRQLSQEGVAGASAKAAPRPNTCHRATRI